jgi:hypothetical protein
MRSRSVDRLQEHLDVSVQEKDLERARSLFEQRRCERTDRSDLRCPRSATRKTERAVDLVIIQPGDERAVPAVELLAIVPDGSEDLAVGFLGNRDDAFLQRVPLDDDSARGDRIMDRDITSLCSPNSLVGPRESS